MTVFKDLLAGLKGYKFELASLYRIPLSPGINYFTRNCCVTFGLCTHSLQCRVTFAILDFKTLNIYFTKFKHFENFVPFVVLIGSVV